MYVSIMQSSYSLRLYLTSLARDGFQVSKERKRKEGKGRNTHSHAYRRRRSRLPFRALAPELSRCVPTSKHTYTPCALALQIPTFPIPRYSCCWGDTVLSSRPHHNVTVFLSWLKHYCRSIRMWRIRAASASWVLTAMIGATLVTVSSRNVLVGLIVLIALCVYNFT